MQAVDLAALMARLPEPPKANCPRWNCWRRVLWRCARDNPAESFMTWPCVYHTMLCNHWPMDYQLSQLRECDDWAERWEPAIVATAYSSPADIQPGTGYSKDLINHAYHLLQWESHTRGRIDSLARIVEIGGGYGAMALVARRLGFCGKYTIYDLPEYSLLQSWFLGQQQVGASRLTRLPRRADAVDLLVGIYSLSEIPFGKRQRILDTWEARSYLLAYQHHFLDYANLKWFMEWASRKPEYHWWAWRMEKENDRPDYYRIGMQR